MQVSKSSARALPATLLPLLLLLPGSSLGATLADRSACIHSGAAELSAAAACGDKASLQTCFQRVPAYVEASDLEHCFRNAGCTNAEAGIEAAFLLHNCGSEPSDAELRRRSPEAMPAPAPAPIPQDTTTTTAATSTTATSTTAAAATSILCSTASTTSTSTCTTSAGASSCFETTLTTSVCAATNICMTDKSGNDICMVRKDTLDTSGLVITIFLGVCFALGFATLVFFACRDKRAERKARARKQAADIAKTNAANATAAANAPREETAIPAPPKREPSPAPGNPFADGPRY